MDDAKIKVAKSKMNSNLSKDYRTDKKCRSNAAFQTRSTKKRGVYVESKPAKDSQNNTGNIVPIGTPKRIYYLLQSSAGGNASNC